MRVRVLERDGSSREVVVKFLLLSEPFSTRWIGVESRLATEPMRANRTYSCLPESVPRLVAGPTNPEKEGRHHWVQAFAMGFVDSTTLAEDEYRSCNDAVPGLKIRKGIRNLFFSPGLLTQLANFTARVEPEIDPLLDTCARLRSHALRWKDEDPELSATMTKVEKLVNGQYFPSRLVHGDLPRRRW